MQGSYTKFLARQSAAAARDDASASQRIAKVARRTQGGRISMPALLAAFSPEQVERAIEQHRVIYPVTVDTAQGVITFYEAN